MWGVQPRVRLTPAAGITEGPEPPRLNNGQQASQEPSLALFSFHQDLG